ncbi:hypothetical protein CCYA_CCYA15G3947 [Cyanidiococcus yangmingshanensis]|nr:hypothetical protein CCYA_CCYA15G3947 [Cyanidiococcus yangmingshanensis]
MSTTRLAEYLGSSQLAEAVALLGRRESCSDSAVSLLEFAAELQDESALEDACRIVAENLCQPSPIVTERFLELLQLCPHKLLQFVSTVISGSLEDVEMVLKIYKELLIADRSLVIPVLASVSELPLSNEMYSYMLDLAIKSLDSVVEDDVPALLRAILKLAGPRSGHALKRIHWYLRDASPELLFIVIEVLDEISRTDHSLLERMLSVNFAHLCHTKKNADRIQFDEDPTADKKTGRPRGSLEVPSRKALGPFDLCLWIFMLSRARLHRIVESVVSTSINSGLVTVASLKSMLPKYAPVVQRFSSGALRFLRAMYALEDAGGILLFCTPTCFEFFRDIRKDIVKDMLGICFNGTVPLQSGSSLVLQQRRKILRLRAATILRDLCLYQTEAMLSFSQLIVDRLASFPLVLHEEAILNLLAEVFRILGAAEPSALSSVSSLIRKQALWQWNSACNVSRLYIRATPPGYSADERYMVLKRILDSVPADAREISAAALLGLIADSVEHGIDPGMFAYSLEKMLPHDIMRDSQTFHTTIFSKRTLLFTQSALRAYRACMKSSCNDLRLALPIETIKLYEVSLFVSCLTQKQSSFEPCDDNLMRLAAAISTMESGEVASAAEAAIHGRQILLTSIGQESGAIVPGIMGAYSRALDKLERALAVGMLLLLERVPDSKHFLARIEALYKSCPEETSISLRISRIIHSDLLHSASQIVCLLNELERRDLPDAQSENLASLLSNTEWLDYLGETTILCMRKGNQLCLELAPALLRLWYLTIANVSCAEQVTLEDVLGYDPLEYFEILTFSARTALEAVLAANVFELCMAHRIQRIRHREPDSEQLIRMRDRCVSLRKYALTRRFDAEVNAKDIRNYLCSPCGGTSRHPYLSERYRLWKWLCSLGMDVSLHEARRVLTIIEDWKFPEPHPEFACLTSASAPWLALCLLRLCTRNGFGGLRSQLRYAYYCTDICLRTVNFLEKNRLEDEVCRVVLFNELLTILPLLQTKLSFLNHVRPQGDMSISFVRDAVAFVLRNALRLCDKLCEASKVSKPRKKHHEKNDTAGKRLSMLYPRVVLRSEALRGEILSWNGLYAYNLRAPPDVTTEEQFALRILENADPQEDNNCIHAEIEQCESRMSYLKDLPEEVLDDYEKGESDSDDSVVSNQPSISGSDLSEPNFYVRDGFGYPALEEDPTHRTVSICFTE